jgi:hypothetical protein
MVKCKYDYSLLEFSLKGVLLSCSQPPRAAVLNCESAEQMNLLSTRILPRLVHNVL